MSYIVDSTPTVIAVTPNSLESLDPRPCNNMAIPATKNARFDSAAHGRFISPVLGCSQYVTVGDDSNERIAIVYCQYAEVLVSKVGER